MWPQGNQWEKALNHKLTWKWVTDSHYQKTSSQKRRTHLGVFSFPDPDNTTHQVDSSNKSSSAAGANASNDSKAQAQAMTAAGSSPAETILTLYKTLSENGDTVVPQPDKSSAIESRCRQKEGRTQQTEIRLGLVWLPLLVQTTTTWLPPAGTNSDLGYAIIPSRDYRYTVVCLIKGHISEISSPFTDDNHAINASWHKFGPQIRNHSKSRLRLHSRLP